MAERTFDPAAGIDGEEPSHGCEARKTPQHGRGTADGREPVQRGGNAAEGGFCAPMAQYGRARAARLPLTARRRPTVAIRAGNPGEIGAAHGRAVARRSTLAACPATDRLRSVIPADNGGRRRVNIAATSTAQSWRTAARSCRQWREDSWRRQSSRARRSSRRRRGDPAGRGQGGAPPRRGVATARRGNRGRDVRRIADTGEAATIPGDGLRTRARRSTLATKPRRAPMPTATAHEPASRHSFAGLRCRAQSAYHGAKPPQRRQGLRAARLDQDATGSGAAGEKPAAVIEGDAPRPQRRPRPTFVFRLAAYAATTSEEK